MATPLSHTGESSIETALNDGPSNDNSKATSHSEVISNIKFNFSLATQSGKSANFANSEDNAPESGFVEQPSVLLDTNSSEIQNFNNKVANNRIETNPDKDIAFYSENNNLKIATGLSATTSENKFPIVLPSSSTNELGNSFSQLVTEGAENNMMTEIDILSQEVDTESMQTVTQVESKTHLENILLTKPDEIGGFISKETASVPKFNIDFSSIFSQEKSCSVSGEKFRNSCKKFTGTTLEFKPILGTDIMTIVKPGKVRYQCINMMEVYAFKCLEELRFEDYKEDRKGVKSSNCALKNGGYFLPDTINTLPYQDFVTNTTPNDMQFPATGTNGVRKLLEGIKSLLDSGSHSDMAINVKGQKFKVHKNILSLWSPVFSAMVENKTNENPIQVVNIDDCDPAIFSDFLHFLYTGSTKKVNAKNVSDLYELARKYQVYELSTICIKYMKNNNPEQACQIS